MSVPVITLITDFGNLDGYVGAMKGAILSIAPQARIVDITHEIPHGRVSKASFVLESILPFYPEGTVHLVVVDPGVGSRRRPLAVGSGGMYFVGPDNGVLEPAYRADEDFICHELKEKRYRLETVSTTFHGRDLFAPAAAHLAAGVGISGLGPPVGQPVRATPGRRKIISGERIVGRVMHADRFGNLITDITARELEILGKQRDRLKVCVCGREIDGVSDYYSQGADDELLALVGSTGRLEIAINLASALDRLGPVSEDAEVTVSRR